MTWETVKNSGHLLKQDNLKDGIGVRNSRDFLQKVVKAFIESCVKFHDITDELPFVYRERQIHSVLLPSITKVADAAFIEQPITRKIKKSSSHGWLDYWVVYGSTVFIIELKHAWCSATSNKVRKTTQEAWKKALEQLKSVTPNEAKDLSLASSNLVKMAMLVVPFYQSSQDQSKLTKFGKKEAEELFDGLLNGLTPKPNWGGLWLLHQRLQRPIRYNDGRHEIYPYVGILAQVDNSLSLSGG